MIGCLLLLGAWLWDPLAGVQIKRLTVPRWVQNGTEDSVVLDCEYETTERDERLVVKWFLNDDPEPIYQWIPELSARHASARVRPKLNMDYKVSPDLSRYRALNLLRPTTDLSGTYSCHVDSILNQDTRELVMTVVAPPKTFEFDYARTGDSGVNLTCSAGGVYPLPKLSLFRVTPEGALPLPGLTTSNRKHAGAYWTVVSRLVRLRDLTRFHCLLTIPGTEFKLHRSLDYVPGDSLTDASCPTALPGGLLLLFCMIFCS